MKIPILDKVAEFKPSLAFPEAIDPHMERCHSLVEQASSRLGRGLASRFDEAVHAAICHHLGRHVEIKEIAETMAHRCRFIVTPDKVSRFVMDETPLLEIYPPKSELTHNSLTVTQSIRRLYQHD